MHHAPISTRNVSDLMIKSTQPLHARSNLLLLREIRYTFDLMGDPTSLCGRRFFSDDLSFSTGTNREIGVRWPIYAPGD